MDVYQQQWNFEMVDMVFIDCVHDYIHVKSDIENYIKVVQQSEAAPTSQEMMDFQKVIENM